MQVIARDGESFEELFHRFKKSLMKSGILSESKSKRHFIPKSVMRRNKIKAAQRKRLQRAARQRAR